MRILICSNAYPPRFVGGAELMAHEQARALSRLGHEVRVFAGDLGSSLARHERSDDVFEGVPTTRIGTVPEDYSPEFLNFLHPRVDAHFKDVLESFRPDIVHCHNLMGLSVKLPILARQRGARVVCTLHDFWGFCLRNTAVRADGRACDDVSQCRACLPLLHDGRGLNLPLRFRKDFIRLALDHVEQFIAPSRYIADRYIWAGLPADRLAVIPNGVDVERFRPAPEAAADAGASHEEVRISYVGYLGEHKGVATLLDAMALLPPAPRAVLQLVGEGPERDAYRARGEALKLGDRLRFFGKVPPSAMPSVYASSDIVVLPSIWDENQPVCLMEAMAAGLPVVASRKGGILELIAEGENGWMFAAGDPADLAARLTRLIGDRELRRAAGNKGRERVQALSHASQAKRVLDVYAGLLRLPHRPAGPHSIFGAVGSVDGDLGARDEMLPDHAHAGRYFLPLRWAEDWVKTFAGAVFMGEGSAGFARPRFGTVLSFPAPLRKWGTAWLRRVSRRDEQDPQG